MSDERASQSTRPSLLMRLRDAGDAGAWATFVDVYTPLVYGYLRRRGLQDADAADVAQEVMTEVARSIRAFEYQPERGRFRDWLGTLARRRLARFLERQRRGTAAEGEGALGEVAAPQAEPEWADEFNAHLLRAALERVRPHFEPPTWDAFRRVWLDGRAAPEVAAELGQPVEAVYVAKSRVLKRLQEEVLLLAEDLPHVVPLA
jgi:RNA polymerase sigma-70 factor (ECF subfamily)